MAKAKAQRWLREAFRDGVDDYVAHEFSTSPWPHPHGVCWLYQHDPAHRLCSGPLERFHFIRRQDVEAAMWQQLPGWGLERATLIPWVDGQEYKRWRDDLILLAAWDARNGGIACEQHHRRYDRHQVSLPREQIVVPYSALPSRVPEFAFERGIDHLLDRFPSSV